MGAQTAREALIAELLQDVDQLLDRADAIRSDMNQQAEQTTAQLQVASTRTLEEIQIARTAIGKIAKTLSDELKADQDTRLVVAEQQTAQMRLQANRITTLAIIIGACSGLIAGALATLAMSGSSLLG